LIHDLALDAFTERTLAEQYGVSQPSIHEFRERHAYQIMIARDHIESELSGMWIADKVNRLAELTQRWQSFRYRTVVVYIWQSTARCGTRPKSWGSWLRSVSTQA
jgi:hypothetical protein